jgi:hypothetical protein
LDTKQATALPDAAMRERLRAIGWTDQRIEWFTQVYASRWTKRTWNRYLARMEAVARLVDSQAERGVLLDVPGWLM